MAQSRYWIGTSYDDEFACPGLDVIKYAVYQREKCPSTGKLHWQFFIIFLTKRRFNGVKRLLGSSVHVEVAHHVEKSRLYCMKEETRVGAPIEIGHFGGLQTVLEQLKKRSVCQVIEENPTLWRSVRALQILQDLTMEARKTAPRVVLLSGRTGSGKSKIASIIASFVGPSEVYFKAPGKWWDGYHQQSFVVLDEFRGRESLPVQELLQLLNHLPVQVERKGSSVQFASDFVLMTSNIALHDMYVCDALTSAAVKRRIKEYVVY